MIHRQMKGMYI